jgi:hypothetical protein
MIEGEWRIMERMKEEKEQGQRRWRDGGKKVLVPFFNAV